VSVAPAQGSILSFSYGHLDCSNYTGIGRGVAEVGPPEVESLSSSGAYMWYIDEWLWYENGAWHYERYDPGVGTTIRVFGLWHRKGEEDSHRWETWYLWNGAWQHFEPGPDAWKSDYVNFAAFGENPEWVAVRQWIYDGETGKWYWTMGHKFTDPSENGRFCRPGSDEI
jgi:hypothetical protein